jgi:hypothetical protein
MTLTNVPTRTLWRAFDRLRRSHRHPSNMPAGREDVMVACMELAAEIDRRYPRSLETRLDMYGVHLPTR